MKDWQWQEIHASTATAEIAALQILEDGQKGRPRILLSGLRKKRLRGNYRRFDFKFGLLSWGWRTLIRVDLYHAYYLGWLPIGAFSVWQVSDKGSLDVFEFNHNLAPMLVEPERTAVYLQLKQKLLTDPLPRGFVL